MSQLNELQQTLIEVNKAKQELVDILAQTKAAKESLDMVLTFSTSLAKYGAICYTQQKVTNTPNGEFVIKYPYESFPNNGLLFMVPQFSSIKYNDGTNGEPRTSNKLIIKYPQIQGNGSTAYTGMKTYTIIKEDSVGRHSPATLGDIVSNRLAIFRFVSGDRDSVILTNNPYYNNLQASTLYITGDSTFGAIPSVLNEDNTTTQLATAKDITDLNKRVSVLEGKFIYGTDDAEGILHNSPEGTIYIKLEEV